MTSALFTHSLSVCAVQPILAAIDMIAAHRDGCSPSWSRTIRTARARTSGENLLLVYFVMAPPSQELEPPINPGRFTSALALIAVIARPCLVEHRFGPRSIPYQMLVSQRQSLFLV
jgi:hypothetical protein